MKQVYFLKLTLLFTALIFVFSSCRDISFKQKRKVRNFVCVVDFSSSPNSLERQEFYLNVIKNNVIKNLALTDRIIVIPLDKASTTNSSEIFIENLSLKDFSPDNASPMEEDQLTQQNFKIYKDSMGIFFENSYRKCMSDRQSEGTDLFGAINNVKGYFNPDDDNYIIFLSDMMNYTEALKMEPSNSQFTTASIDGILKGLPGITMQNVMALVLTGNEVGVSQEHFDLVHLFWDGYFKKNNIKLYNYSSAAVSKIDELMALPLHK